MSQIFSPAADTWLRVVALVTAAVLVGLIAFAALFGESTYATLVGWTQDQPVPFSHQHHVGELDIDCRYCHSTVEVAAEAGLPSTQLCMTCHSQLWTEAEMLAPVRESLAEDRPLRWRRVADVPDYVFFDHSIHIDRGVSCVACHGRIDQMPLTFRAQPFQMQWCLDCHRNPQAALRPPDQVTRMDWSDWDGSAAATAFGRRMMEAHNIEPERLDDCALCHR